MTWSYSTDLSTDKDKVRFLTGLNDTTNQRVTDEEIAGMLSLAADNVYEAGAMIADSLAGKYASSQSLKIDGFSTDYSDKADQYRELAKRLRATGKTAPGSLGTPFVGGISISEMDSVREDSDRNPSRFEMDTHTYPGLDPMEVGEYNESD